MNDTVSLPPRPGGPKADRASMLRVDQAGEYGAVRIYAGQLAVLGDRHPISREIAGMAAQEERHRAHFDAMMAQRGVRPTLLQPFWHVAGFALGAATALIGPRAAIVAGRGGDHPVEMLEDALHAPEAPPRKHRRGAVRAGSRRLHQRGGGQVQRMAR